MPLVLILLIVMPLMFIFGWIIYIVMIRRIIDQDMFVSLLATFGLSLLMQQVINLIFGPEVQTSTWKCRSMTHSTTWSPSRPRS